MIRILADRHHGVLWEALAMLFVDRAILGPCELLAFADGYYVPPEAERFEIISDFPPRIVEAVSESYVRANRPDYIIATAPNTRGRLQTLARELGAVYVDQCGNEWDPPIGSVVLRSMTLDGAPGVLYHPEFHRVPPGEPNRHLIAAFHSSLLTNGCTDTWTGLQDAMPDYEFRLYGVLPLAVEPHRVAPAMAEAGWIYHDKTNDGYGFGVHEAFASGRPVIGHARHYEGKLAGPLWVPGVTYVEPEAALIRAADWEQMASAAQARFAELVDFDAEAKAIADYLGNA